MATPVEIHGVKYYSTRSLCIANFEEKPLIERAIGSIVSWGPLLVYGLDRLFMMVTGAKRQMAPYTRAPGGNSSRNKLIVCLHGLGDGPTQFKKIVDEMKQEPTYGEYNLYVPKIRKRGYATLDDAVFPVLEDIVEWAKTGKEKELVLVGISNGGRIARAIEAALINSNRLGQIKRLQSVSIVGACKGSGCFWMPLLKKLRMYSPLLQPIAEEMSLDSVRGKQLERAYSEAAKKMPQLVREYTYIASPHDWLVPEYDSSLPEVSHAIAYYAIVPYHGHISIVHAVAKSVAAITIK